MVKIYNLDSGTIFNYLQQTTIRLYLVIG